MKYWVNKELNYITSGTKVHYIMYDFPTTSAYKCCCIFLAKGSMKQDANTRLVHLDSLLKTCSVYNGNAYKSPANMSDKQGLTEFILKPLVSFDHFLV